MVPTDTDNKVGYGCATNLWVDSRSVIVDLDAGWSGCGGLVVRMCPDVFPAVAGLVAAQGEDAGGAGDVPAHAGLFEALADHRLAAGFDDAGADEQAEV